MDEDAGDYVMRIVAQRCRKEIAETVIPASMLEPDAHRH
jgi:hypothetical protein